MERAENGSGALDVVQKIVGEARKPVFLIAFLKWTPGIDAMHANFYHNRSARNVVVGARNIEEARQRLALGEGAAANFGARALSKVPIIGSAVPLSALQGGALVILIARQAITVADLLEEHETGDELNVPPQPAQRGWFAKFERWTFGEGAADDVQGFFSRWRIEGNPLRKKYKEAGHMFKLAMAVVDLQKTLSPGNEQFKIAMCDFPLNIKFVADRGGEVLTRAYRWAKEKFSGRQFGLVDGWWGCAVE